MAIILGLLSQTNVLERVCMSCKHFWFEDIEDGTEPCQYCRRVRSVKDGKVVNLAGSLFHRSEWSSR